MSDTTTITGDWTTTATTLSDATTATTTTTVGDESDEDDDDGDMVDGEIDCNLRPKHRRGEEIGCSLVSPQGAPLYALFFGLWAFGRRRRAK